MSEYSVLEEILNARTFKPRVVLSQSEYDKLDTLAKRDYEPTEGSLYLEKEDVFLERKRYWDYESEHWDDWLHEEG